MKKRNTSSIFVEPFLKKFYIKMCKDIFGIFFIILNRNLIKTLEDF